MSATCARLFVAVEIPEALELTLASRARRLAAIDAGVRPIAASAIHLTLSFLGEVERSRIPALAATLERAVAGCAPCDVELVGLGAFPKPAIARVVWVGVRVGEPLRVLAAQVQAALADLGFELDPRPFHPHVTIGRLRAGGRHSALAKALAEADAEWIGAMRVSGVTLFESTLSPTGATYTALARVPLCGEVGASLA